MDFSSFNNDFDNCVVPAIESLFNNDPQLRMFEKDIRKRYGMFEETKRFIEEREGMDKFTRSYEEFGVVMMPDGGVKCLEWAPNAEALYLQGDFSNWEKVAFKQQGFGKWELYISPDANGTCPIRHLSELKLVIETKDGQTVDRISPWARHVVQRSPASRFNWLFWNPPKNQLCQKQTSRLPKPDRLRIYEAHIGIASDRCEISTYKNFTRNVLPRIRDLGYNCVLLMAVMEHPFYPSLGFQVTNFFAASSRYGTPEDLKELIQVAHSMGLYVTMDVVHNQASKNVQEGINNFDGSEGCYLDHGRKGYREGDDTRAFDYSKWEVLRFLMSNLRYYMEEFCFDGFRFNGVTSMMYQNNSFDRSIGGSHENYFGNRMNFEGMVYLMLANDVIHKFYPNAITIAEDYSSMPTLCRPVYEGGIGFDYKSAMKLPELWRKFLIETREEDWNMEVLFEMLSVGGRGEKCITYAENHEQSLVGRMTLSHHLLGCEDMSDMKPPSMSLDRGMSLYKMIRLITHSFVGNGYMNFMGNEFGHPDWIEFPSPSNNNNMQRARRQFYFAEDDQLRYKYLNRFDAAMNRIEERFGWLKAAPAYVSRKHNGDKVFVFERAGLLFIFNFHPNQSYSDYRVGVEHAGRYKIVLDTDDKCFGGRGKNQLGITFNTQKSGFDNRSKSLTINLSSRSAIVMVSEDFNSRVSHNSNVRRQNFYKQKEGSSFSQSHSGFQGTNQPHPAGSFGERQWADKRESRRQVSFQDQRQSHFPHSANYSHEQSYCGGNNCNDKYSTRARSDSHKYRYQPDNDPTSGYGAFTYQQERRYW